MGRTQYKDGPRAIRQRQKRKEAFERLIVGSKTATPHSFQLLTLAAEGEFAIKCTTEGCAQQWDPRKQHTVPESHCPWKGRQPATSSVETQKRQHKTKTNITTRKR